MTKVRANNLYGTVDLLILRTLSRIEPAHGLGISGEIRLLSDAHLHLEEGALYPALHRLERDGLIAGTWKISEKRRRARFYSLTARGRKRLEDELADWVTHTSAIRRVLGISSVDLR